MTRYTWRYVAKSVLVSPICREIWDDIVSGAKQLGYGLFCLAARCFAVGLFPISVPLFVYLSRRVERQYEAMRPARQKAMDEDV